MKTEAEIREQMARLMTIYHDETEILFRSVELNTKIPAQRSIVRMYQSRSEWLTLSWVLGENGPDSFRIAYEAYKKEHNA